MHVETRRWMVAKPQLLAHIGFRYDFLFLRIIKRVRTHRTTPIPLACAQRMEQLIQRETRKGEDLTSKIKEKKFALAVSGK